MDDKFNSIEDLRDHITALKNTPEHDKTTMLLIADVSYMFGREDGVADLESNSSHYSDYINDEAKFL